MVLTTLEIEKGGLRLKDATFALHRNDGNNCAKIQSHERHSALENRMTKILLSQHPLRQPKPHYRPSYLKAVNA